MGLKIPAGARKGFDEELRKLLELEPAVRESNAMRYYLGWLTQVRSPLLL